MLYFRLRLLASTIVVFAIGSQMNCSLLSKKQTGTSLAIQTPTAAIETKDIAAPVTLISFQSVTCTFCKEFNRDLTKFTDEFPTLSVVIVYPYDDFRQMMPPEHKDADNKTLASILKHWIDAEPSLGDRNKLKGKLHIGLIEANIFKEWQANNTPTFVVLKGQTNHGRIEGYNAPSLVRTIADASDSKTETAPK